jgi:deoxyribonuclease-4
VFVAGYDIRTPEGIDSTLDEIDRFIGLDRLRAFHLNDSAGILGSNTDRHAHIGKGELGIEAFRYIVNDERVCGVPGIIELPHGRMEPEDDLALLRSLVK